MHNSHILIRVVSSVSILIDMYILNIILINIKVNIHTNIDLCLIILSFILILNTYIHNFVNLKNLILRLVRMCVIVI